MSHISSDGSDDLFPTTVPEMPEGYYSGDQPNPNLRAFVEAHVKENPYDPTTDDYDIPAFDRPIETTKATAIYNMHTYWSKKPHDAIRQYILHYTQPGDLVLDPFCGSGGTALAALMEGRKAIAIDRSPAATFITKNYCTPVDVHKLQAAFEELKQKVEPEMRWLYGTKCDRCGGDAMTAYTVYSQVFECPRCLTKVALYDCPEIILEVGEKGGGKSGKKRICPICFKAGICEHIKPRGELKLGIIPVMVSYLCENGCKPVRAERRHDDPDPIKREFFEQYDLNKIAEIDADKIPYWFPTDKFIRGDRYSRDGLKYNNVDTVADLFTKRNLWALAMIKTYIINMDIDQTIKDSLLFAYQGIILINSRMTEAKNTQITKGTYYCPQVFKELLVINSINTKIRTISEAQKSLFIDNNQIIISTDDAQDLKNINSDSIDFIFTDPPYADKVQYGELNFVWEAWLGFDTHWLEEEIIINEVRGKSMADWAKMMRQAMAECFRVLKPGRWISLCYHDTSEGTWHLLQDMIADVGFIRDTNTNALYIDAGQKSFNQLTADKVTKRDLVINFRKPKPGEFKNQILLTGEEDTQTFNELACAIIRDYLISHPGETKDRIYDHLVSNMVRSGRMQPHDFEKLLRSIAVELKETVYKDLFTDEQPNLMGTHEMSRWFLKHSQLEIQDESESRKEEAAASEIHEFMKKELLKNREQIGVHYTDIFEHYLYAVTDKPRHELSDWLIDYFFKTEEGTWRPPADTEEEKYKAAGRVRGIMRHIKRYLGFINAALPIPSEERPDDLTMVEWIKHCRRNGMWEQGKLLYEKGGLRLDRLNTAQQMAVEEDYDICMRALSRIIE